MLRLLSPGCVYELRALDVPEGGVIRRVVSGYFDDHAAMLREAELLSSQGARGVYYTLNPVRPELLARAVNRVRPAKRGEATSDADIVCRRWLPVDLDPVRPAGISSTAEELAAAMRRAQDIGNHMMGLGWPEPVCAMSGSGSQLVWRIDLPAESMLVARVLAGLDAQWSDASVKVDTSVSNAARIWKVPNTMARKGDSTEERPHRLARLVHVPEAIEIVSESLLEAFAPQKVSNTVAAVGRRPESFQVDEFMRRWLPDADGPHDYEGGRKWILPVCAFDSRHNDRAACVIELASGALSFKCHHESCSGRGWRELRELFDPVEEVGPEWKINPGDYTQQAPAPSGRIELAGRSHVDLVRATLRVLREKSPERLVYDEGALWRYDAEAGVWQEVDADEQRRGVWRLDGAVYPVASPNDELITEWRELKITAANLRDVPAALHAADRIARPGFFSAAPAGCQFRDRFVAADGRVLEKSPELRQRAALAFDFDPGAACPRFRQALSEWFELDDDREQKIEFLSEFVGAALLGAATRYQRGVLLLGQGSNGKSALLSVVSALFPEGTRRAVSPKQFGSQWYVATLRGARINIETDVPPQVEAASTFKKALSGEPIMAAEKFKKPFTFAPTCGHLFSCNQLPAVDDLSHGFWRRWVVLEFKRRFDDAACDRGLVDKIVAAEMPGVAAWALAGAHRLLLQGDYTKVPSSDVALGRWAEASDPVRAWLVECTQPCNDRELAVRPVQAFEHFYSWCVHEARIRDPLSRRQFFLAINSLLEQRRAQGGRWYPVRLL